MHLHLYFTSQNQRPLLPPAATMWSNVQVQSNPTNSILPHHPLSNPTHRNPSKCIQLCQSIQSNPTNQSTLPSPSAIFNPLQRNQFRPARLRLRRSGAGTLGYFSTSSCIYFTWFTKKNSMKIWNWISSSCASSHSYLGNPRRQELLEKWICKWPKRHSGRGWGCILRHSELVIQGINVNHSIKLEMVNGWILRSLGI